MKKPPLPQLVEAVLFAAAAPVSLKVLADTLDVAEEDAAAAIDELKGNLANRGLRIAELANAYQMVTIPEAAGTIERFLGKEARAELSRPALETLSIVIYNHPVTRAAIEEIRGVASDQMLRNLLQRDLIEESGAGKQPQYRPSLRLLQHLGLTSLDELPSLEELNSDQAE